MGEDGPESFMRSKINANTASNWVWDINIENDGTSHDFTIMWCPNSNTYVAQYRGNIDTDALIVCYESYVDVRHKIQKWFNVSVLTNVHFVVDIQADNETSYFTIEWYPPMNGMVATYHGDFQQPDLVSTYDVTEEIGKSLVELYAVVGIENVYFTTEVFLNSVPHTFAVGWHKESLSYVARYQGEPHVELCLCDQDFKKLKVYFCERMGMQRLAMVRNETTHNTTKKVLSLMHIV